MTPPVHKGTTKRRRRKADPWSRKRRRTQWVPKGPFPVLALPAELRRLVYRHCIVWADPLEVPIVKPNKKQLESINKRARRTKRQFGHLTNLQLACKQVRSEVVPIFYQENCFRWCSAFSFQGAWGRFLQGPFGRIHSLMIPMNYMCDCFVETSHLRGILAWLESRECRSLITGPGKLSLKHLCIDVLYQTGWDLRPERLQFSSPRNKTSWTRFPRVKSLRSIQLVTHHPVSPRWVDMLRSDSGCLVKLDERHR